MAMAMAMRRAAALGARHILAASSTSSSSSSGVLLRRHMSVDAGAAMEKVRAAGLLRTQGLIGGKWVDAYDGKTLEVQNPATGETLANVSCMGSKETSDAIASAHSTFYSWSKLTANERSKALRKWHDLIISHKEELALLMTLEQGKPMKEALGEVTYGASFIEYFAEEAKRIYGDIIPPTLSDRRLLVLKQPVGVVGAVTPWNFPLAMITRKVGPALACGCTVVVKPSEFTPLTALAAADLALQAGIPAGAINVVMGNAPEIGDALLQSTQVRKITFTGSTAVGKKLMAGSANTVKKSLKVGNGLEESTSQGPLINEAAVQKVEKFINDATSKGANIMLGGKRHSLGMSFYEPTVVGNVSNDMLLFREEVFGPVAPLVPFKTEEDAIHMANDTNAGLAAYIFTKSIPRSWRVSEALEYGLVGVNEGIISTEVAPFGGVKQSGLGREGSKYGMDEYLELKYICMGNLN
uniref:Aldehyde dehydrogenase domain-containing protein n=1 Tax=Oryza meridionalis TaxID=40149 RepID=A0A0E0CGF4_9ORYZ